MSFDAITKRILPKLKRITYRLNGHFSFFNDQDLLQEALFQLWLDFNKGKLSDKTDSYILQGCYFHLKNYIRKNYDKTPMVSIDSMCNDEDSGCITKDRLFLSQRESTLDYVHCKLLLEQIQNNGLTKREKEVFSFSLEDLTTREIGARLGFSHVRVVKLKKSVREKCRKYFDLT